MNEWLAKNFVYNFLQFSRGEKIFKLIENINHIPKLSSDEIRDIQFNKLKKTIKTACRDIPFYQILYKKYGINPEKFVLPDDLEKLPVINKSIVHSNYTDMINQLIKRRTSKELTSGSSGNPITVIKDRDKSGYGRAVMFRCYGQHGIDIGHKQARFWGVPISPKDVFKEKCKDMIVNRIRLSAFDIHDQSLLTFTDKMIAFQPRYFYGYPSVLHKYATWIHEKKIDISRLKLKAIITTGEILYPFQKDIINKVFGCRVVNEYGSTEVGIIAFECIKGNMHINSDHVFLESVNNKKTTGVGELIVTELNNQYNPLIRFKIGDRGCISANSCDCGINFPIISSLAGRDSTFIVTPDGKYVNDAILEYTFAQGIKRFRAVQNSRDTLNIKIVKTNDLSDQVMVEYKKKLVKSLGDALHISYEFVPEIEPEKSGKLRYFISNLNEVSSFDPKVKVFDV
jgi:phenylacetate-CoA ligase